jgi:hypothetical protein
VIEVVSPEETTALGGVTVPPVPAEAVTVNDFGPPPPPHDANVSAKRIRDIFVR